MNNLRDVLVFISLSLGRFLAYFFSYTMYFLFVLVVTISVFFVGYRLTNHFYIFAVYLVLLVALDNKLRRTYFLKKQFVLNISFIQYMENNQQVPSGVGATGDVLIDHAARFSREYLKEIKDHFKKLGKGGGNVPTRLLSAAAAWGAWKKDNSKAFNRFTGALREKAIHYILIEAALFVGLLLPFMVISFFFSREAVPGVQALLYLLGFFFVTFLDAALIGPIVTLLIQAELVKRGKSEFYPLND